MDALSLAVKFFVDAAAQDQDRVKASRDYELWQWQQEMAADETGASIDALALGLPTKSISRSYGGVSRQTAGRRL